MNCRHCGTPLALPFLDLGFAPPSNAYLAADELARPEKHYPLRLRVCEACWLVQTEDYADAGELFSAGYAYFSSTSSGWLAHAARFAATMSRRLGLGADSLVVEVAANDGYLLKNFVAAGIPCLGIEPTAGTAAAAEALGIPIVREFFGAAVGRRLAAEGRQADLLVGNNVLAHVPDINDFVLGLQAALKPGGTLCLEFPHLLRLIEEVQFDTVYHEHFSYLSLYTVRRILHRAGLRVCEVEELPTHGGSLRVFACHADDPRPEAASVAAVLASEAARGLQSLAPYRDFQARAERLKDDFLAFLIEQKRAGRSVAAYGAAAKGNTLLNFAGVKPDLLSFVCDAAPAKQGRFMPGSHLPILAPAALRERRPDFLVILPWNIAAEVRRQNADLAALGTRFVTAVPRLEIASPPPGPPHAPAPPGEALAPGAKAAPIPYTRPSITALEIAYAGDAAANGWGTQCYAYIERFEEAFKAHLGVRHAIATSSCTGALHLGMAALGIGPGDEVILADTNWIASAAPIVHLGATPVFVDILADSWCLDPQRVEAAITPRTKAILAVHLYGNLCEMAQLLAIGEKHGIPLIEDAAEAIGSVWHGRRAGAMGRFGAFSFHGTKTLSTGEGGMFVTSDTALYEKVLTLSNHGRARGQSRQFWPEMVGFKYKMSNLQAAIGCAQLERIEDLVARKREILHRYAAAFAEFAHITMNPEPAGTQNGCWMPTVVFAPAPESPRDRLLQALQADGIDARVFFWPLSSLPMFPPRPDNVVARALPARALNLPSFHDLSAEQQERIIAHVLRIARADAAPHLPGETR